MGEFLTECHPLAHVAGFEQCSDQCLMLQIQSELGEGHLNIINSTCSLLTDKHLGIAMEYASGGSLTQYVTNHFPKSGQGLFLSEDETRYFFKVLHCGSQTPTQPFLPFPLRAMLLLCLALIDTPLITTLFVLKPLFSVQPTVQV